MTREGWLVLVTGLVASLPLLGLLVRTCPAWLSSRRMTVGVVGLAVMPHVVFAQSFFAGSKPYFEQVCRPL